MRSYVAVLAISGLAFAADAARAGRNAYTCQVSQVYGLGEGQVLKNLPAFETVLKEHPFSVSRETGQIIAESAIDTSRAKEVRLLNRGSKENSFKATADFGDFPNGTHPFQFLEIQEFLVGKRKPFILASDVGLITGWCE